MPLSACPYITQSIPCLVQPRHLRWVHLRDAFPGETPLQRSVARVALAESGQERLRDLDALILEVAGVRRFLPGVAAGPDAGARHGWSA